MEKTMRKIKSTPGYSAKAVARAVGHSSQFLDQMSNDLATIPLDGDLLKVLDGVSSHALLEVLKQRGGHPGALAEAAILCAKKSLDYNAGKGTNIHNIDRSNYFPLGLASYAQMIHTKSERLLSLVRKGGDDAIFESARDTCLDLINYAGFAADHLQREVKP